MLNVPVNSYGHVGTVSSLNHTFLLSMLIQQVNQYFMHMLLLVTDNNPSWISRREEKLFHDQFQLKNMTRPGSSFWPFDLQSDTSYIYRVGNSVVHDPLADLDLHHFKC